MELSQRIQTIKPSSIIKIADKVRELEKAGKGIIRLDTGEPNFDTPACANDAAKTALDKGYTHYSGSRGIDGLREKLCAYYNKKYNSRFDPAKNILITPGAKQAIFYAVMSIVDPGDEVIIVTPGWVSYEEIVNMAEGKAVFAECDKNEDFDLSFEKIKEKVSPKTKAIILNSPNNPTGRIIRSEDLKQINDLCVENDIVLIADEVYDRIIFDGNEFSSILSINPELKNCIYINGFSKTYAMTGWRLGYIICEAELASAMLKLQQNTVTCPSTFLQYGAVKAMEEADDFIDSALAFYQDNKDALRAGFKDSRKIKIIEPQGGLYAFLDVSEINQNSYDFCLELLEKKNISAIPGAAFGECGEGYIRICLAAAKEDIGEFIKRINEY